MPELEAAAQAFEEIGDLRKLSRDLDRPNSVLATLPDWLNRPSRRSHLAMAGCLFMSFAIVMVTQDALLEFYRALHLSVPAVTHGLGQVGRWMESHSLFAISSGLAAAYVILWSARTLMGRYILLGALIGNGALVSASLFVLIWTLIEMWC
jgi:hypothetical protein